MLDCAFPDVDVAESSTQRLRVVIRSDERPSGVVDHGAGAQSRSRRDRRLCGRDAARRRERARDRGRTGNRQDNVDRGSAGPCPPCRPPRVRGRRRGTRAGVPVRDRPPAIRAIRPVGCAGRPRAALRRRGAPRTTRAGVRPSGCPPTSADAVVHGLYWLAANVAEQQPAVICVDDAHWADAASLRWLAYLGRRLEGLPLLLIIAARPLECRSQRRRCLPRSTRTRAFSARAR